MGKKERDSAIPPCSKANRKNTFVVHRADGAGEGCKANWANAAPQGMRYLGMRGLGMRRLGMRGLGMRGLGMR